MKKNYQTPFNMALSFIAFIFCSTFLCGCSKSNFGVNESFFSNMSHNNRSRDKISPENTPHDNRSCQNIPREQTLRQNNSQASNTNSNSNINSNSDTKANSNKNRSHNTYNNAHNNKLTAKNANHILKMSLKQIEDKLGAPSFTLQNKDIGNTKSYYSTSWYYVYYQIQNNNVTHNHKLIATKCLVIRFDDSMNVVGAQYLYSK
jgi:hypothetical protein